LGLSQHHSVVGSSWDALGLWARGPLLRLMAMLMLMACAMLGGPQTCWPAVCAGVLTRVPCGLAHALVSCSGTGLRGTIAGGVANVDIDGNHTLEIKSIGVAISTFETLPI